MLKRHPYSYSILRYVHDVATGEFANVGIAVHCKDLGFFEVSCRSTAGRISNFFPDLNAKTFRAFTKLVSSRFKEISQIYTNALTIDAHERDLDKLLSEVLPKDDSALSWTPTEGGLTADPGKTLTELFERYVSKYDHHVPAYKKTDDDVWRHFSKELENRHISKFFVEKTIAGIDDKVRFKSAWKNGKWHCVEPISFDLSAAETIREKAHRFLGQMTSVADTSEKFKLYIVLAMPTEHTLQPAYEQAVQILEKLNGEKEIYTENEISQLVDQFYNQIERHGGDKLVLQ